MINARNSLSPFFIVEGESERKKNYVPLTRLFNTRKNCKKNMRGGGKCLRCFVIMACFTNFLYMASVIAKEVEAAKYSYSNYPCLLCVSGAGVA